MRPLSGVALAAGAIAAGFTITEWLGANDSDEPGVFKGDFNPEPSDAMPTTDPETLRQSVGTQFADRGVAPPAWQVKFPDSSNPPKGVMLVIHGGAWVFVGPDTLASMDKDVERWRKRGWITVNVDYRAGTESVKDVLTFYDAIRQWQGEGVRVGAIGSSAGGHLAMMVASERPDLEFVVSQAGPTWINRLGHNTEASISLEKASRELWGDLADTNSPALHGARMGARLLLGTAETDQLVPARQMDYMKEARPDATRTMVLGPGDIDWVHGQVSQQALDEFWAAEEELARG